MTVTTTYTDSMTGETFTLTAPLGNLGALMDFNARVLVIVGVERFNRLVRTSTLNRE